MGLINMLANFLGAMQVIMYTKFGDRVGVFSLQISVFLAIIIFATIPNEREIKSIRLV